MIDLIPVHYYTSVFNYVMLFIVLATAFHISIFKVDSQHNIIYNRVVGYAALIFVVFYMGYRPLDKVFEDMIGYAQRFEYYMRGGKILEIRDGFFQLFNKFLSNFVGVHTYFLICAAIYIIPLYIVSKKWFKRYWFYAFLMLIGSFSFWGYGVNGIRNGLATSLFLLALAYKDNFIKLAILFVISALIHKSMLLPIGAYFITRFYHSEKMYFVFWGTAILLSMALGSFWENLFVNLGIDDERVSYLTTEIDANKFSKTGFRWDFLIYSFTGVYAGWYFINKKKFKDAFYAQIVNIYLVANAVWILVIRASFSNRFAYLSWFILAIVIFYPFLKGRFFKRQNLVMASIMLCYYLITFLLNEIL